jgi:signal transduction histidine kinase
MMAGEEGLPLEDPDHARASLGTLLPLFEASQTLLSEIEIERLYQLVLNIVQRETKADAVSLMLLDRQERELRLEAAIGLPEEMIGHVTEQVGQGIAGSVAQRGQPLLLSRGAELDATIRQAMQRDDLTSALCIPLKIKGRVIGVVNASKRTHESPFSYRDLELLSILVSQIAIAIENSRAHEATRNRSRQLTALNDLSQVVTSTLDLDEVLRLAMQGINEIISVEAGILLLLDETTNELVLRTAQHGNRREPGSFKLQVGQGIPGFVVKHGKPLLVAQVGAEPLYCGGTCEYSRHIGLICHSALCVPLVIRDHVIGALELVNRLDGEFTGEDSELLNSMAATVAIALENARLYTELADFARELEKSRDQLLRAEKLAATGKLAASLAHEINNPLQAIQNCLHLVLRKPSLDQTKRQQYLSMAQEEVRRLIDLVQRMLDFYRPSKEGAGPVQINDVLDDVLSLAAKRLQQARIAVHRDTATPLPPVHGVNNLLKQVFLNIIINASDAMPDGGDLYVDTDWDETRGQVVVSFTDTGEGIPVSELAKIFDPFYTTKAKGTGLGLSVSHRIVESHGGRIDVKSEVQEGSTFTVRLPTSTRDTELV